jgi:hypothetical protein
MCIVILGMSMFVHQEYNRQRDNTYANNDTNQLYIVRKIVDTIDLWGNKHRNIVVFDVDNKKEITIDIEYFRKHFYKYYN